MHRPFQSTLPILDETSVLVRIIYEAELISIHSSHTGRDGGLSAAHGHGQISIHSSHTGRDYYRVKYLSSKISISIHSSHTGRDIVCLRIRFCSYHFNPLFPYGKRPVYPLDAVAPVVFQSTLPIREETQVPFAYRYLLSISIHSSHTGRDPCKPPRMISLTQFQSTLPIREETIADTASASADAFQSTLPIREETRTG